MEQEEDEVEVEKEDEEEEKDEAEENVERDVMKRLNAVFYGLSLTDGAPARDVNGDDITGTEEEAEEEQT